MHRRVPRIGEPVDDFINCCGQPSLQSNEHIVFFDIPSTNAQLVCFIDENRIVQQVSSSIPIGQQGAVELAKRFLPDQSEPVESHLDTLSSKMKTTVQTYELPGTEHKMACIVANEIGAFTVSIQP